MKTYLLSFVLLFPSLFGLAKGYPPYLGISYNQTTVINLVPFLEIYEGGQRIPSDSIPLIFIFSGDSIRLGASGGYEGVDKFQISRYDSLIYENNVSTVNMYIAKVYHVSDTGSFTFYADNDVSYSVIHFKVKYFNSNIDKTIAPLLNAEFSLYPNPVINEVIINGSDTLLRSKIQICIYDVRGNIVLNLNLEAQEFRFEVRVPMKELPSGTYIFIFQSECFTEQRKIIKSG